MRRLKTFAPSGDMGTRKKLGKVSWSPECPGQNYSWAFSSPNVPVRRKSGISMHTCSFLRSRSLASFGEHTTPGWKKVSIRLFQTLEPITLIVSQTLYLWLATIIHTFCPVYLVHWPIALNPNGNDPLFPKRPNGVRDVDQNWDLKDTWSQMEAVQKKGKSVVIPIKLYSMISFGQNIIIIKQAKSNQSAYRTFQRKCLKRYSRLRR
jgi:hypothetical protein